MAVARAGIVGRTRGRLRRRLRIARATPRAASSRHADDDARGVAVEAGIVGQHADEVLGLIGDIARAPGPGTTITGLTLPSSPVMRLCKQRLARRLARRALRARTPDDGVEGLIRAGDMDLVHAGMLAEIRALRRAAVDDAQVAAVDQRAEGVLDQRAKIGVDGIGLEDHHLIFDEQLIEDVERADAGDIARAQHQRHLARMFAGVDDRLGLRQPFLRDARLHPDFGRQPAVKELVIGRLWEDLRRHLAVWARRDRAGDARRATRAMSASAPRSWRNCLSSVYGPVAHSSPTPGVPGAISLARRQASTQRGAIAAKSAISRSTSAMRSGTAVATHASFRAWSAAIASSITAWSLAATALAAWGNCW